MYSYLLPTFIFLITCYSRCTEAPRRTGHTVRASCLRSLRRCHLQNIMLIIRDTFHLIPLTWSLFAQRPAGCGDVTVVTGVRLAQGNQLASEVGTPEALARVRSSARRAQCALDKHSSQERGDSKVLHHADVQIIFVYLCFWLESLFVSDEWRESPWGLYRVCWQQTPGSHVLMTQSSSLSCQRARGS